MITIEPVYNRFKVRVSNPGGGLRGFFGMCDSMDGVHVAIDHIMARKHDGLECTFCREQLRKEAHAKKLLYYEGQGKVFAVVGFQGAGGYLEGYSVDGGRATPLQSLRRSDLHTLKRITKAKAKKQSIYVEEDVREAMCKARGL